MKKFLPLFFVFIFLINNLDSVNLLLDGQIKRALILSVKRENWRVKLNKKITINDSWIDIAKKNKLIAHRLGDYSRPNTIQAAINSHNLGIKFMEVDLTLNNKNNICILENKGIKNCRINNLLDYIAENDIYLIIDFKKSIFEHSMRNTLNVIESSPNRNEILKRIIFQLYESKDIKTFLKVIKEKNYYFNLPIITLYRSKSTLKKFINQKPKFLNAITIPIERKNEVISLARIDNYLLMTHPIKNCKDFEIANKYNFDLLYGPSNLKNCRF